MRPSTRAWRSASLIMLCAALGAAAGCQKLIGAEERTLVEAEDDDAGTSDAGDAAAGDAGADEHPSEEACADYCTDINEVCAPTSALAAYRSADYCPAVCGQLITSGNPSSKTGNNFECRLDQLAKARILFEDTPSEATGNCRAAGPGGDNTCGTNCESYCQLYANICADFGPNADCATICPKLRDDPSFNATTAFGGGVDTIQCRLAHLSAAAIEPKPHCQHAALVPTYDDPCNPAAAKCTDYCSLVMNVCDADGTKQYENTADCLRVCEKGMTASLPLVGDEKGDTTKDTVACRKYHTYNALISGPDHCNHAGPSGDGHCGKVCPAYCAQAAKACGANGFAAEFVNEAGCLANCAALVGKPEKEQADFKYNVNKGKAGGNNISCRIYHLVKAFGDPAGSCPSALGDGACKP